MIRTTSLILGLALLATSAHAADEGQYTVTLQDKSPAQIHSEIERAASKACEDVAFGATAVDMLAHYDYLTCKAEAVHDAQQQADAALSARAARMSGAGSTR